MIDKIVPPALKLWLVFLFVFLLLGYGVVPSILLGALAGFAGGTMIAWWTTPGGEPAAPLELSTPLRRLNPNQLIPRGLPRNLPRNLFKRSRPQRLPRARR